MRLTLRTLLAHLDKTLEPDDDDAIATKLKESDFAANLVRRITSGMASATMPAPSAASTSTVDDANRIGEYLDSVLPAEQITEIERICLESDMHLAEVAACHQILTLVLGNKADVPPALRSRIYSLDPGLADMRSPQAETSGDTSGQSEPAENQTRDTLPSRESMAAVAAAVTAQGPSQSVMPVGLDDSGVSNAPTRLREYQAAQAAKDDSVSSGRARRIDAAEASEIFGRSSRLTPWLVGLTLAISFLLVAALAFAPLFKNGTDSDDQLSSLILDSEAQGDRTDKGNRVAPSPKTEVATDILKYAQTEAPPLVSTKPDTDLPAIPTPPAPVSADPGKADAGNPDAGRADLANAVVPKATPAMQASGDSAADKTAMAPGVNKTPEAMANSIAANDLTEDPFPTIGDSEKSSDMQVPNALSFLTMDKTLCLVRKPDEDNFTKLNKDEAIPVGSEIVCPPLYRNQIAFVEEFAVEMIGPAQMTFEPSATAEFALTMTMGRFLLSSTLATIPVPGETGPQALENLGQPKSLQINFGAASHTLTFTTPGSLAAIEIVYFRSPGEDPELEGSSVASIDIMGTGGRLLWKTEDAEPISISTGERVRWSPMSEATKDAVTTVPEWLNPPEVADTSIESSARDGLVALVQGDESIELLLRDAIGFRRAEVGSLAAQTLLLLDRPDVYFGTEGILSNEKQKTFWPDHFNALVRAVDRGPESAAIVNGAINQMNAAEGNAIYRLLWLFSNEQLQAGSDQLLIEGLDNPNMAIRVLASENLRRITGTTLFYKPENETALRRAPDIRKWEPRLRRGEIRWPEAPAS